MVKIFQGFKATPVQCKFVFFLLTKFANNNFVISIVVNIVFLFLTDVL